MVGQVLSVVVGNPGSTCVKSGCPISIPVSIMPTLTCGLFPVKMSHASGALMSTSAVML